MSKRIQDLEKELSELKRVAERRFLRDIDRAVRTAKKSGLPAGQAVEYTLGAILEYYEIGGDAEVTFKDVSGRPSAPRVPAASTFTVSRGKKGTRKTKKPTTTKPTTTKPATPESKTPSPEPPTKAPVPEAPTPKEPTTPEEPTPKAPNTVATIYKAPAYWGTAPTHNTPKYELHNFRIPKRKPRADKPPSDDTNVAVAQGFPGRASDARPRKRKAGSELSGRPRQRMATGDVFDERR